MADCTISGVILDSNNALAAGIRVYCVKLIGADLITDAEQKLIATSTVAGVVSFVLPQGSTAYLSGNFFVNGTSFNVNDGIALSIPASSTVDLIDLAAVASFPDDGAIVQDDGVALPLRIGTFNFGAGIAVVPGAAGVATFTAAIASTEAVQDAISTLFPSVGAYTWAYNDAGNSVGLVIAPATTSVNGLFSAADKTTFDAVPSTYALASALTSEISTRAAADALLLVKASNLSDLTDAAAARENLGVGLTDSPKFAGVAVRNSLDTLDLFSADSKGRLRWDDTAGEASSGHLLEPLILFNRDPTTYSWAILFADPRQTGVGQVNAYFSPAGDFSTVVGITQSNKRNASGLILGVGALADGSEPYMSCHSTDINGPALALESHSSMTGDFDNQTIIAGYDLDDISGGSTALSVGYGRKKFAVSCKGMMLYGSDLLDEPLANALTKFEPLSAGGIAISTGASGVYTEILRATSSGVGIAKNGAASSPPLSLTGTWFTGGSTTTTKPQLLIESTGATSNNWESGGSGIGVNAPNAFAGRLLDLQVNGTSKLYVDQFGQLINLPGAGGILWANAFSIGANDANINVRSSWGYRWSNSGSNINTIDTGLYRQGVGIAQVGTGSANALGKLDCAEYRIAGVNITTLLAPLISPSFTTPSLGVASATSLTASAPGTVAAPALALNNTNTGFYFDTGALVYSGVAVTIGGGATGVLLTAGGATGLHLGAGSELAWTTTTNPTNSIDTKLYRSAAGVVGFGTTTTNALGSILALNATLSGIVTAATFKSSTALVTSVDGASDPAFLVNSIGSTGGPTTAAQNGWLKAQDSGGATVWIPVWK